MADAEAGVDSNAGRQRFLKGFIAGAAGGVVGAGAKLICEAIVPPRAPGREPPPGVLVSRILERQRGYGLDEAGKQKAALGVHWTFSIVTSAFYGVLAEFLPLATVGYGAFYGWGLWLGTHEAVLPALGLTPPVQELPATEQINEFISHGIFGVSAELTRRFIRRHLRQPARGHKDHAP